MDQLQPLTQRVPAGSVAGVGVDLLDTARIRVLGNDLDDPFFRRTFTAAERAEAASRPDPVLCLAQAFSAKEAVFKALGLDADRARLEEIEITLASVTPAVTLHGRMAAQAVAKGIVRCHLALSYRGAFVLAMAVAEQG